MSGDGGSPSGRAWTSNLPPLIDADPESAHVGVATRDRRDGAVYVMEEDGPLALAVDVALATNRPLLLRGEPGSGKSSLAAYIARNLGWRYYEHVVTARTRARDLLYTFDSVRKLSDASRKDSTPTDRDDKYVEPGVLWWAFDRESAFRRGAPADAELLSPPIEPDDEINANRSPLNAVVLVDEIDKADPDLPNGLLVPLGSSEFRTLETGVLVTQGGESSTTAGGHRVRGRLLVIITTNEERDLPPAFIRRCVIHRLRPPDVDRLVLIGRRHLRVEGESERPEDGDLLRALATKICDLRTQDRARRPPSTAEFLDALHACRALGVSVGDTTWSVLERLVLLKDETSGSSDS
jgi:MoxR-like ATPase